MSSNEGRGTGNIQYDATELSCSVLGNNITSRTGHFNYHLLVFGLASSSQYVSVVLHLLLPSHPMRDMEPERVTVFLFRRLQVQLSILASALPCARRGTELLSLIANPEYAVRGMGPEMVKASCFSGTTVANFRIALCDLSFRGLLLRVSE